MSEHNLYNKHDLTAEEIAAINKEVRGFMFEPKCVEDVGFVVKTVGYPTGKKAEVKITIRTV